MDYEVDDESGEKVSEREFAKTVAKTVGIPAKFLTIEFFRTDAVKYIEREKNDIDIEDYDSYLLSEDHEYDVEEEGEWVRQWINAKDNEFGSSLLVRALISPEYVGQSEKSFKALEEDISRMKLDTDTADFLLKTKNGSKEFPVHKTILRSRSNVFRAMFASNMAEVSAGEAIIEDLDDDTLEELIHFLYSGGLSGSRYDIVALCNAAEKYELASLMDLVSFNMRSAELDVNQLADLFIASEMFSQEEMFEIAKEKLTEGMGKVMGVKDIMKKGVRVHDVIEKIKDHPELTNKILEL